MSAVTSKHTATVTLPADDQILIVREFQAPPHLVYQAYTTPDLVKRWWSGKRGQVTSAEIDLRVGGAWRYVMTATGGFEVAFHGEFREIVPNERLVTTEVYEMPDAPALPPEDEPLNIVSFIDLGGGRTRMETVVQTTSQELRDMIVGSGMEAGMQESYDALEEVAASLA